MTETVITVQGRFETWYAPERAIVAVTLAWDGADRQLVVDSTIAAAASLGDGIEPLHDPVDGPITWWASDRVRVWSDRPWNDTGQQLPLVHHAAISMRARFRDFDALAVWVEKAAIAEGVAIEGITWELTEAKRTSVTAEVRSRAVRDAVDKATVFAQSIGLKTVRAIAIADPGMLGDQGAGAAPAPYAKLARAAAPIGGGGGLSFTPEDIPVEAIVDARFVAS